jgi:uncharacterized protein YciI
VKAGWLAPRGWFQKPSQPFELETTQLVFVKQGPNWSSAPLTPGSELLKAHLANFDRLAAEKKLIMVGPFLDEGQVRGVEVYRVKTMEEAKALVGPAPAIKAGALVAEYHTWMVARGVLT